MTTTRRRISVFLLVLVVVVPQTARSFQVDSGAKRRSTKSSGGSGRTSSVSSSASCVVNTITPPPQWHLDLVQEESIFPATGSSGTDYNHYRRDRISRRRRDESSATMTTKTTTRRKGTAAVVADDWVRTYTSVAGLRRHFGTNANGVWGDLDATTTRRLYKTLLPTALLQLQDKAHYDYEPVDLAPLAFQARLAAKLYARERCHVPARVAARCYDGVRQWIKYGRFQTAGMTYQQLWAKYYAAATVDGKEDGDDDDDDVTTKVCRTILEKSCQTNEMVDALVKVQNHHQRQPGEEQQQHIYLKPISEKLERDVRALLQVA